MNNEIIGMLETIQKVMIGIGALAFLILTLTIFYGMYKSMKGASNPEEKDGLPNRLLLQIVGMVILALSYFSIDFYLILGQDSIFAMILLLAFNVVMLFTLIDLQGIANRIIGKTKTEKGFFS